MVGAVPACQLRSQRARKFGQRVVCHKIDASSEELEPISCRDASSSDDRFKVRWTTHCQEGDDQSEEKRRMKAKRLEQCVWRVCIHCLL